MSKHTPGPWFISSPKHCAPDQVNDRLIHDSGKRHIAEVFQYQNHENPDGPSIANARLIAAGPDLLDAAKLALEKCPFPVGAVKAKEALEAAIAKAEGRS